MKFIAKYSETIARLRPRQCYTSPDHLALHSRHLSPRRELVNRRMALGSALVGVFGGLGLAVAHLARQAQQAAARLDIH
ncbi:hypothetical protein AYO44_15565 [Planctomycetaceae bacterium SCGC AG-212-F19]|nr:hypothetical protein AYO44_15565 [Planctomycetaceae bacterium SCGC AG-212-F19]